MVSTPVIVAIGIATAAATPVTVKFKVSVPLPPVMVSDVEKVSEAAAVSLMTALKVSFPLVPGKESAPVVSVRYVRCKSLILNSVIIFTLINDEITT